MIMKEIWLLSNVIMMSANENENENENERKDRSTSVIDIEYEKSNLHVVKDADVQK